MWALRVVGEAGGEGKALKGFVEWKGRTEEPEELEREDDLQRMRSSGTGGEVSVLIPGEQN